MNSVRPSSTREIHQAFTQVRRFVSALAWTAVLAVFALQDLPALAGMKIVDLNFSQDIRLTQADGRQVILSSDGTLNHRTKVSELTRDSQGRVYLTDGRVGALLGYGPTGPEGLNGLILKGTDSRLLGTFQYIRTRGWRESSSSTCVNCNLLNGKQNSFEELTQFAHQYVDEYQFTFADGSGSIQIEAIRAQENSQERTLFTPR